MHPITQSQQTQADVVQRDLLKAAITEMDALSQNGFSEIAAIANLALLALEHRDAPHRMEHIAYAFSAICGVAECAENCINSQAEEVGCNYIDQASHRRMDARRAAH